MAAPSPISPELLIEFAGLDAEREHRGVDWCRKHGVGARRARLGRLLPINIIELESARSPEMLAYAEAQRSAQLWLKAHCKACGGCRLSKE